MRHHSGICLATAILVASGMLQKFNRVGAEPASQRAPYERGERGETNNEDRDLGPFVGKKAMHGFSS
jgi:hypothetical protein